ncbi:hypothetical protein, partial [Salmonella sp. SAL04269]|uniref:hypothetical protein n=1 Tax=Salmonella sp. SAL04269 TaxID=3159847 RepID=UPI0039786479
MPVSAALLPAPSAALPFLDADCCWLAGRASPGCVWRARASASPNSLAPDAGCGLRGAVAAAVRPLPPPPPRDPAARLRVGFLSNGFGAHPTG